MKTRYSLGGIVTLGIAIALLLGLVGFKGCMVSDGFRDGDVQKFTKKGIVFSTWEGELALSGYKRTDGGGSVWEFSVYNDDVAATVRALPPGETIRLHYRQRRHVWPWQGATAYEVYAVEAIAGDSKEGDRDG